jgi:signal transduction histidine kinase
MIVQRFHAMGMLRSLAQEQLEEFKTNAMQQIRYMSETIDEFRNFYRQEKQNEIFQPRNSIADAVRLLKPQFASKGILVDLICPDEAQRSSKGYPNEFKQVILNLLANARDAILICRSIRGEPEDGRITVVIDINPDNIMIIDISDNGCGVPDSMADQIFDPYFTTKEENGGTGIGLYVSRMIMEESLRGSLNLLQSERGATFRIELPLEVQV